MDRISEIQRKLDFCIQKTESLNLTSILDKVSRDNLQIDGSSKPRAFAQLVTAVAGAFISYFFHSFESCIIRIAE